MIVPLLLPLLAPILLDLSPAPARLDGPEMDEYAPTMTSVLWEPTLAQLLPLVPTPMDRSLADAILVTMEME